MVISYSKWCLWLDEIWQILYWGFPGAMEEGVSYTSLTRTLTNLSKYPTLSPSLCRDRDTFLFFFLVSFCSLPALVSLLQVCHLRPHFLLTLSFHPLICLALSSLSGSPSLYSNLALCLGFCISYAQQHPTKENRVLQGIESFT